MSALKFKRRGFSLIELLIATVLSLVIGGGVILLLVSQTQLTATSNRNMINQDTARSVLNFMSDEISLMGNNIPENLPLIDIAEEKEFRFLTDVDNDGVFDRIRYFVEGHELHRTLEVSGDGINWNAVGNDVLIPALLDLNGPDVKPGDVDLEFTYFGVNNSTPATMDDITAVQIRICLDTNADKTAFQGGRVGPQKMVQYATIRMRRI